MIVWKKHLEGLLKHSFLDFTPRVPHSIGLGWDLRFHIFNSLPGNVDAAGWVWEEGGVGLDTEPGRSVFACTEVKDSTKESSGKY